MVVLGRVFHAVMEAGKSEIYRAGQKDRNSRKS